MRAAASVIPYQGRNQALVKHGRPVAEQGCATNLRTAAAISSNHLRITHLAYVQLLAPNIVPHHAQAWGAHALRGERQGEQGAAALHLHQLQHQLQAPASCKLYVRPQLLVVQCVHRWRQCAPPRACERVSHRRAAAL